MTAIRALCAAGLALLAAGCFPLRIDESAVFKPPKVDRPATVAAELTIDGQEKWERDSKARIAVRHGFLGEGDRRVAYSLVSAADKSGRPLVVHCGGNASDRRRDGFHYADKVLPYGDVLLFDYPGYGDSGGTATAPDLTKAVDSVAPLARAEAAGRPLVFWGHSLGGFVCTQLANRLPDSAGLVLEATARNVNEIAVAWTPWYAKPFIKPTIKSDLTAVDNARDLAAFKGKILVLGAKHDGTLPVYLARSLAKGLESERVASRYVEFEDAGHSSIPDAKDFAPTMSAFFAGLGSSPGAQAAGQ